MPWQKWASPHKIRSFKYPNGQHHIKYPVPGASHRSERRTTHCSVTGWGSACQHALSPRLTTVDRRTVQTADKPIHISPHVGSTTVKTKTSVGHQSTEVRSKLTEIRFFHRFWTNFCRSLANGSFAMKVS
jgi:hypothetical protein